MIDPLKPGFHPRFSRLGGQPQDFTPFAIELPTLGAAMIGPAQEMATAIVERDGVVQPLIILADRLPGQPALALGFQPSPEQARRLARTLLDFADGRAADLLRESRR